MRLALAALVTVACGGSKTPLRETPPRGPDPTDAGPRTPTGDAPAAVETRPAARTCAANKNPAACPATEPNINATCKKNGVECSYGTSCCPPLYVCANHVFEARFVSCP